MRKVSPEIARCVLFSAIAFILGACIKPVGVSSFLEDDKVQGIIAAGNSGVKVDPGYEHPEDIPPELALDDGTPKGDGDFVYVTKGESETITVTNADVYDDIEWIYNRVKLGEGEEFVVDTAPPFDVEGTYQMAVVGTRNNVPYSIEIFIVIEEEE
jgi:hypothetical protein